MYISFDFRSHDRDNGTHLEMDIGRQLSQLREQTRTNRDDCGSARTVLGQ